MGDDGRRQQRAEARSRRLTEARPTVPPLLFGLLIATASIGVFVLGTFTLASVARRVQVGVLVVLAALLAVFIGVIWGMDRPYDGTVAVEFTDMTRVAGDLTEEWGETHPDSPLPCDEHGEALDAT